MATKKQPPKKAAKAAVKSVKKAPAKTARPAAKSVAKKAAKPAAKAARSNGTAVAKKAVASKTARPAVAAKKAAAPKKAAKAAPKAAIKKAAPVVAKKPAVPVKKQAVPVKKETAKAVEPVKKPAVAAPTPKEVKPAIKPLEQAAKKEAAKSAKVVIPKTSTTKAVKYEPDFTKSVLDSQSSSKEQTGPTMRYSDVELAEFRELITRKLETAKKELAYLQGLITRKDEGGDMEDGRYMTMEDGSMSMEREQLSQMASRQIQFIDHLEKALMRIENKTYGICRVTGKLIDKARLRAVPHATLSIEAKQLMNK
jgi:RNA polymerase-binding transcription factor DksA